MKLDFASRMLKYFFASALILPFLFLNAFAAGSVVPVSSDLSGQKVITIATVNVQDAKLIKQDGQTLTISFTISNRLGIQPAVIYGIQLFERSSEGVLSLADQKIFSGDVLSLGVNTSVHKEISYSAPSYLKGTYVIKVEARNSDGMLFGNARLRDSITLNGINKVLSIDQTKCFLSVGGEAGNETYTLSQGVDISKSETLTVHCSLINMENTEQSVYPFFQLRYRSEFGKIVGSEKGSLVVIAPSQTYDFVAALPKPAEPQAYDAILTFTNKKNEQIAPPVVAHFVLRGESATIENLKFDKENYQKGEIATVSFIWNGSADGFPDARVLSDSSKKNLTVAFSILDSHNNVCSQTRNEVLDVKNSNGVESFSIPIIRDCTNPVISAKIINADGKVLAENNYQIGTASAKSKIETANEMKLRIFEAGLLFCALLIFIAFATYLILKKKRNGIALFIGLMIGLGTFAHGHEAKADTYRMFVQFDTANKYSHYVTIDFIANIDKSIYDPGEPIVASAEVVYAMCNNGWNQIGVTTARVDATINGVTHDVFNQPTNFVAENIGGDYYASFNTIVTVSGVFKEEYLFEIPMLLMAFPQRLRPSCLLLLIIILSRREMVQL